MMIPDIGLTPFVIGLGFWGTLLGAATGLGKLFGGGAEGAEQGRLSQADRILMQNRNLLDRHQQVLDNDFRRANLDLERRGFQEQAPSVRLDRAKQATLRRRIPGAVAARDRRGAEGGMFDRTFQPGDFAPTDEELSLAELIQQQDLSRQQAGDQFEELPDRGAAQLQGLPERGLGSRLLDIGGGILSGIGVLNESGVFGRQRPNLPTVRTSGGNVTLPPSRDIWEGARR